MVQDYGASIGIPKVTKHPKKVAGFVVTNGNAYEEGLKNEIWIPIIKWPAATNIEVDCTQISNSTFQINSLIDTISIHHNTHTF